MEYGNKERRGGAVVEALNNPLNEATASDGWKRIPGNQLEGVQMALMKERYLAVTCSGESLALSMVCT